MDLEFSIFIAPEEVVALVASVLPEIAGLEWRRGQEQVHAWGLKAVPPELAEAVATPYPAVAGTISQIGHRVSFVVTAENPAPKSADEIHPSQCLYWSFGGIDAGLLYLSTMTMRSHLTQVIDFGRGLRKRLVAVSRNHVQKDSSSGWVKTSLRITRGAERMHQEHFELRQRPVEGIRYRV